MLHDFLKNMLHDLSKIAFAKNEKQHRDLRPDAVFLRRRRDSNPRTDFGRYTISSRAPSTKLGDFSSWPKVMSFLLNKSNYIKSRPFLQGGSDSFHENYTLNAVKRLCAKKRRML